MKQRQILADIVFGAFMAAVIHRYYVTDDLFEIVSACVIVCFAKMFQIAFRYMFGEIGIAREQEPKYGTSFIGIYNRRDHKHIPPDEPVFIFRAKDELAVPALKNYAHLIEERTTGDSSHLQAVRNRVKDFEAFARKNPGGVQFPTT